MRKAAVWGLISEPCLMTKAVMNLAQPVLVFRPIALFTKAHSLGTCSMHREVHDIGARGVRV